MQVNPGNERGSKSPRHECEWASRLVDVGGMEWLRSNAQGAARSPVGQRRTTRMECCLLPHRPARGECRGRVGVQLQGGGLLPCHDQDLMPWTIYRSMSSCKSNVARDAGPGCTLSTCTGLRMICMGCACASVPCSAACVVCIGWHVSSECASVHARVFMLLAGLHAPET